MRPDGDDRGSGRVGVARRLARARHSKAPRSARTSSSRRSPASTTSRSATPETRRARLRARSRLPGRVPVHPRRLPVDVPRAPCGRCASSRASARRRRRTSASATCSSTARPGSRPPSTCPRSWATTPTTRARSARSGAKASPIDSLDDMETLFAGIPLGEVSTSMTINSPAAIAARVLRLRRRGAGRPARPAARHRSRRTSSRSTSRRRSGSSRPSRRCGSSSDMIEFCAREMPLWHPVSISGYHIREAGSTAAQELAFTLADGFAYVEAALERGLDVDDFAPRLSFFFNAHLDFFEEIAKYRAARRIWAARAARPLRREERALAADALPRADRGRLAHRAAARGEHRAHRARGARGRARRDAVACTRTRSTRRSRCRPRTRRGSRSARSR